MYYTRQADIYDVDAICDLYNRVADYYLFDEPELEYNAVCDFVEDDSRLTIIATCGEDIETVAGVITAHIEDTYYGYTHCWIDGLIVHPEHVVSQPLLDHVQSWALLHGCKYIQMSVDAAGLMNDIISRHMERKDFFKTGYTMRKVL